MTNDTVSHKVRNHFGKLAEDGVWASLYTSPRSKVTSETWSFLIRVRRVIELLGQSRTRIGDVLDVGCGTAPIAASIVAMGANYTGVDFSPEMISAARKNVAGLDGPAKVNLSVGDVLNLGFQDGSFDAVIAMGVMEYLSVPQIGIALLGIRKVLRTGGVAILTIPKRRCWGRVFNELVSPLGKLTRLRPYRQEINQDEEFQRTLLSAGEVDRLCANAGLIKMDVRHYNVEILSRPLNLIAPRFCYLVNRPFENLALFPGGDFLATGYIGLYEKGG